MPVIIPGCSEDVALPNGELDVRCSFLTFKKLIGKTLKHECVADTLKPFVDSLLYRDVVASKSDHLQTLSTLAWVVFGVLVLVFLALSVRHAVLRRRASSQSTQKREYGTLPQVTSG